MTEHRGALNPWGHGPWRFRADVWPSLLSSQKVGSLCRAQRLLHGRAAKLRPKHGPQDVEQNL